MMSRERISLRRVCSTIVGLLCVLASIPGFAHPMGILSANARWMVAAGGDAPFGTVVSFWFLVAASAMAATLGALHALEPAHGKTIVAAYLVGSRRTARHVLWLGFVITVAHAARVFLWGAMILYASRFIVPEQLSPWLGIISGLSAAAIGVLLFLRHLTGNAAEHSHFRGAHYRHWSCSVTHSNIADSKLVAPANLQKLISLRNPFPGISGGIVPCPAALVMLLAALSLHRARFGLFLILAFSCGLALALVVSGLTTVYSKRPVSAIQTRSGSSLRYLPALSAAFTVLLGLGITVPSLSSVRIGENLVPRDRLVPFVTITLLGLFLGMRHSTDPDHVVAVSTIVSREGSIRRSAMIGLLWGLGHTLTIFLVGSAIILFGVIIPPRLGLLMEFSVGIMLILLGAMNLTGVTRWITKRFRNEPRASESSQPMIDPAMSLESSTESQPQRRGRMPRLLENTVSRFGVYQTVRPLAIGIVHGLAGSAAVALLVLATIKSPLWAAAYLLVFGAGTMVGMMFMTAVISLPFAYTGKRFLRAHQYMITTSGLISVVFGLFVVYQIGMVDGLFALQPHWIPR